MLTEFGGIALVPPGASAPEKSWGYGSARSLQEFATRLTSLFAAVRAVKLFQGFCYTQLTDTFQEANGLTFADRRPKLPVEQVAQIICGPVRGMQTVLEGERDHYESQGPEEMLL
jgi:hypothetical protein